MNVCMTNLVSEKKLDLKQLASEGKHGLLLKSTYMFSLVRYGPFL